MTITLLKRGVRDQSQPSIPLICPIRDEMALTPAFLKHYRNIGIVDFIFIDNGSVDGPAEYLLSQEDCTVYQTVESYRESGFGAKWINQVIKLENISGWTLYVDADEHLVYQNCENMNINDFCKGLSLEGVDCVNAIMLDMYPTGSALDLVITSEDNLLDKMGWFDTDYIFRNWPRRPWDQESGFRLQILGGPRCRLLSNIEVEAKRGALYYTISNQLDRIIDFVPMSLMGILANTFPKELPSLQKRPLNYVTDDFEFINSHAGTTSNVSSELVALLHYKFCSELKSRFAMKVEGNHYRRGLAYRQLENALVKWGGASLIYEGSRKFESSADLLSVGLIGPSASQLWRKIPNSPLRISASGVQQTLAGRFTV